MITSHGCPDAASLAAELGPRGVRVVSWSDWQRLDQLEQGRGKALGRPRLKFTSVAEMLAALDGA